MCTLVTNMADAVCRTAPKMGYLRIRWSHGSDHSPNLQSTKSEVCNCKLIRINNQVLLDDGNKIIIPQGTLKFYLNVYGAGTTVLFVAWCL